MNKKILIAKDEAFNFLYRANVDELRTHGEVEFFSPLHDDTAVDCDLLYLPGGYPELFLKEIARNEIMRKRIKSFAEEGGRIFAECGGFMYLCREIDGTGMCGVLPFKATMRNARLHLGYRYMPLTDGTHTLRGHEFHYSDVEDMEAEGITKICTQRSAKGTAVGTALYRYKNVIAGYTHWYWAEHGFPFFRL